MVLIAPLTLKVSAPPVVSRLIETLWLAELVEPAVKLMPAPPIVTVLLPVPPTTLMPVKVVNAAVSILTVLVVGTVTPVGDPVNVLLTPPTVLTVIIAAVVLVFKLVILSDVSRVIITSVPTTEIVAGVILSSR